MFFPIISLLFFPQKLANELLQSIIFLFLSFIKIGILTVFINNSRNMICFFRLNCWSFIDVCISLNLFANKPISSFLLISIWESKFPDEISVVTAISFLIGFIKLYIIGSIVIRREKYKRIENWRILSLILLIFSLIILFVYEIFNSPKLKELKESVDLLIIKFLLLFVLLFKFILIMELIPRRVISVISSSPYKAVSVINSISLFIS